MYSGHPMVIGQVIMYSLGGHGGGACTPRSTWGRGMHAHEELHTIIIHLVIHTYMYYMLTPTHTHHASINTHTTWKHKHILYTPLGSSLHSLNGFATLFNAV